MSSPRAFGRRAFLQGAASMAAAPAVAERVAGANGRVGVGVIGCGGIGTAHLKVLERLRDEGLIEVAAVCDVFEKRRMAAEAAIAAPSVADYRRVLDRRDVDAVLIATPDHWHAPMTIEAAEAGKDIYCEKPMTYWRDLGAAKQVVATIAKTGRVMQVGTNGLSDGRYGVARKRLAGLGTLIRAQAGDQRNGPIGVYSPQTNDPDAVPGKTLDWQMWLGPAPKRPYEPGRYFAFRSFWDYSGGVCTDFFPHLLTPLTDVMALGFPRRVVASGGQYFYHDGREVPDVHSLLIEYASGPSVQLVGGLANDTNMPMQIQAQQGTLTFDDEGFAVEPQKAAGARFAAEHVASPLIGSRDEHWKDLLRSIASREKPRSHEVYGYQVMTALHMGVRSYLENRVFEFDAEKEEVRAV